MQAALYLATTRAMGAPKVRICYGRTESFCHSPNQPRLLVIALNGQFRYTLMTDKLSAAMQITERVHPLAQEQNDPRVNDWSLSQFGMHAVLFGRLRFRTLRRISSPKNARLTRMWSPTVSLVTARIALSLVLVVGSPALSNKRLRCKASTLRLQEIR
jgi:hypothetical protein